MKQGLSESSWKSLLPIDEGKLIDTRLQLHFAAQIPASFASMVFLNADDYSHTALVWDEKNHALMANPRYGSRLTPGLRIEDATLVVLDSDGAVADTFKLQGRTLKEGEDWLLAVVGNSDYDLPSLVYLGHDMPDHPVSNGASFDVDTESLDAMARWFSNANAMLEQVRSQLDNSSPVYCWPHHFDIATLVKLDDNGNHDDRSVGFGLSPGDGFSPKPYWYVLPWPPPDKDSLPEFERAGEWNTDGWVGAVLMADAIISKEGSDQQNAVAEFLNHGWESSLGLLNGS